MQVCIYSLRNVWEAGFNILKRCSKANNKYLKSHDPKQESKHVIYLDANSLYSFAISKFLPTGRFKWTDPKEF